MRRLSGTDIDNMIVDEFVPDDAAIRRDVRTQLHLSTRIPVPDGPVPHHATLDLHQKTEEQAWRAIMDLATSGVRRATIITGASGILKIKFQQWAQDSVLSPYIISSTPINNGSFDVRFHRH